MSLRQVVWTATFLIVTIPLAYIGLVAHTDSQIQARTEAYDAARREWRSAVRSEHLRALGKLEQIRAELASGNVPDWAGEYSWFAPGPRSCLQTDEPNTRGEGLAVAPKAGAVWWFGSSDPERAILDHGRVVSADEERVVIDWTINPKHPHVYGYPGTSYLLSDELVRVKWDEGALLVPAVRMPVFCSPWIGNPVNPGTVAPRRGGWELGHGARAPEEVTDAKLAPPLVPERWRPYVLPQTITASARLEAPPDVLSRGWVPPDEVPSSWWERLLVPEIKRRWNWDNIHRARYCMSAGTDQGLLVGMPVTFDHDFGYPLGVVVAVSSSMAHVEFVGRGLDIPIGEQPYEATMLTTGVPFPSWTR